VVAGGINGVDGADGLGGCAAPGIAGEVAELPVLSDMSAGAVVTKRLSSQKSFLTHTGRRSGYSERRSID
jgi:hypothetical protein